MRDVRSRCGLTQAAFAEKIEVPIETVRNWEQGKRYPRGPARALLKLIDSVPEAAFAALAVADERAADRLKSADRAAGAAVAGDAHQQAMANSVPT